MAAGVEVPAEHSLKENHLRALHVDVGNVPAHTTLHQSDPPKFMHGLLADSARILCEPFRQAESANTAAAAVGLPRTGIQLVLVTKISGCIGGDVMLVPG